MQPLPHVLPHRRAPCQARHPKRIKHKKQSGSHPCTPRPPSRPSRTPPAGPRSAKNSIPANPAPSGTSPNTANPCSVFATASLGMASDTPPGTSKNVVRQALHERNSMIYMTPFALSLSKCGVFRGAPHPVRTTHPGQSKRRPLGRNPQSLDHAHEHCPRTRAHRTHHRSSAMNGQIWQWPNPAISRYGKRMAISWKKLPYLERNPDMYLSATCQVPDDCIDASRRALFVSREVMRGVIESLRSQEA
jgi:hypothetical protein